MVAALVCYRSITLFNETAPNVSYSFDSPEDMAN